MRPYLLLGAVVLVALAALAFIYRLASKSRHRHGAFFLGPAYFLIKKGDQRISRREWIFLALLALFMLFAPLISDWMEGRLAT